MNVKMAGRGGRGGTEDAKKERKPKSGNARQRKAQNLVN